MGKSIKAPRLKRGDTARVRPESIFLVGQVVTVLSTTGEHASLVKVQATRGVYYLPLAYLDATLPEFA